MKLFENAKKGTVILFSSHYLNRYIIEEFRKINDSCKNDFDVILSCDNLAYASQITSRYKCHICNLRTIRRLGYKYNNDGWKLWHNPEMVLLDFFSKNPDYKYYWLIEYDVRYTGTWSTFFKHFLENDADLLATYVRKYKDEPKWSHWNRLSLKVNYEQRIGIFFPVIRFSNGALKLLDGKYRIGIVGFCEVLVPTLLNLEGLKIQDIGNQWYNEETFYFKNRGESINKKCLRHPNKLYHPARETSWFFRCKNYFSKLGKEKK